MNADRYFLGRSTESLAEYRRVMHLVHELAADCISGQKKPFSGIQPDEVAQLLVKEILPDDGESGDSVLAEAVEAVLSHTVAVHHPDCAAHLHCPVLIPSLAAEALISAFNQSMDSWDQSGAATVLEQGLIDSMCRLYGLSDQADGTMTSGGTQSNLMGLMLARDWALKQKGWDVQADGLGKMADKLRILCSDAAHFSVQQSAALLGLGMRSVVRVKMDEAFRIDTADLDRELVRLKNEGLIPFCVVATAGTTDFGSIDPLHEVAAVAKHHGVWVHVDAAYGGALVLSERERPKLAGLENADSITVDFHKLMYQPIPCSLFMVANAKHFELMKLNVAYLNPESNETIGVPDLVSKSIATTRRFDALKPYIAFRTLGRRFLAQVIESAVDSAMLLANWIDSQEDFELAIQPELTSVVFRLKLSNEANLDIKQRLLLKGEAIIGQTEIKGRAYLKFTIINPYTSSERLIELLMQIREWGRAYQTDLN